MDPERQRLQEDLRGLVAGDVRCDDVMLQLYASDASIYELRPLAVVRPKSTADVAAVVAYAAEKQLPVFARGAGTGLAGESLGPGIVIDFSRYMRRILDVQEESVRVQAGVVHAQLNEHLRQTGRTFGPDPANSTVTTIGSMIAVDGSGSYWLRYGSTRQHVLSLQVVLADGSVLELGREALLPQPEQTGNAETVLSAGDDRLRDGELEPSELRRRQLVSRVATILERSRDLVAKHQPQDQLNRSGYQLCGVLDDQQVDLAKLLSGSEGTLAIVTEATLATQALPKHRGVAMLFFDRLESASLAVPEVLQYDPCVCDLLDRRHLSLARETSAQYEAFIPPDAEAMLLVEIAGDDAAEVRGSLERLADRVRRKKQYAFDYRLALDPADVDLFWRLTRQVVPTLHRLKGNSRPIPVVEDVAVPVPALGEFLHRMQTTLKRHQVTASLYGHVGHGQLHLRPFLDLSDPADVQKMETLASELYADVFDLGGVISGEHGDGLSRTPFLRQQYGPLYDVFGEIKLAFDPQNILNPGKIVVDSPPSIAANLRPLNVSQVFEQSSEAAANSSRKRRRTTSQLVPLQLDWDLVGMSQEANRCNGCGACRSQLGDVRMCPIFRVLPGEEASPRAKANLMRGVLDGRLDAELLAHDDLKAVADLCVNCHQCRLECPAGVDIPKLMIEAKAAYVANNGLRPADWMLARFDRLSSWGSKFSLLANWLVTNRVFRWVLEKTLGVAQGRKLPRFAARSFMRRAVRRRLTRPTRRTDRKVLYFVDTFANYHDPQLAEALVAVMEHNGVAVYVHPDQRPSGMSLISMGSLDAARRLATHNVHLLAEAVRQGYHIVATEPSTVLCLTHEYLNLINDNDARTVAANTSEASNYLWRLHQQGKLQLDFKPLSAAVAYHQPCHIRALGIGAPSENLLRLIPGIGLQRVEQGCSGMAGLWGLKRENYRNSLRAGWGLISKLRESTIQAGATECSSCKIQMEQGTSKPTLHPLKLLALSYGLMPEIAESLAARGEELVVT